MDLRPGSKLGPYEIVSALGKGGMGEVWKAHDPQLGRDVAIKVSAQQFTDRFEREARAIAALNHPNVCTLYDIGPNYLVMEYIEGPTLAERIKEGAIPLEEPSVLQSRLPPRRKRRTISFSIDRRSSLVCFSLLLCTLIAPITMLGE